MISLCKKCGFILGTRPNLKSDDGVCLACVNAEIKKTFDFAERQEWLKKFIRERKSVATSKYDCVIAVSGGKDSHMIVSTLMEAYNIANPLLVTVRDEFTLTQAGLHNRENISNTFGCDHFVIRQNPKEFRKLVLKDFEESLTPLKEYEFKIGGTPIEVAKMYGVNLVFYGENGPFEYGDTQELSIFHPKSTDETAVLFFFGAHPYSIGASLDAAKKCGFKTLDDFNEWSREGSIENYVQIDSIGYHMNLWCKFPKFGFQRVSDIACRFVRDGLLTRAQAEQYIKDKDYILDPKIKHDFCKAIDITEEHFDNVVEKHVNWDIIVKDINGVYRRKDLI